MSFRQFILVVITGLFVLFNFSCADKLNSSADDEVVFDDGYQTQAKKNEVTIDDSSFGESSQVSEKPDAHQETPIQLKDESIFTVMYDAFGNKVETREFTKDSRLLLLTVTTSVNGKKEAVVRGRNGERKVLPPEMLDSVLTTNADEIAHTAGIFATQRETELPPVITIQQAQQPKQIYQPVQIPQQNLQPNTQTVNTSDETKQTSGDEQKTEKVEEKPQQQSSLQKNGEQPAEASKPKGTNQL